MASDGDQKQPPEDKGGEGGLISFPKDDDVDDGKKKQLLLQRRQPAFQRIWFPEDEITVLRSLLKNRSEDGVLPSPCQLHPVIRSSLRLQASESQLGSKVQRLRKKFMQNVNRSRSTFGNPHEQRIFDLSSQLWSAAADKKKKKNEQTNAGAGDQKQLPKKSLRDHKKNGESQHRRTAFKSVLGALRTKVEASEGRCHEEQMLDQSGRVEALGTPQGHSTDSPHDNSPEKETCSSSSSNMPLANQVVPK